MLRINKAILDANGAICDNIKQLSETDRGLLSQNILSQIRNFVEYIAIKAYSNGQDVNPNDYDLNVAALKNMQRRGDLRFLYRFHEMLQKSVSHYTVDKDGSERLMLKYYEHLLKIKLYLKQAFNLDVLENISDFPLNTDTELSDYYEKIAERIESPSTCSYPVTYNDRYYVQKVKPFFVKQQIYYEVTFTAANANASKFDRVIAFTRHEIVDNYAVKFSIHNDMIRILDKDMSILVIDGYEVSIRPCEWDNLSEIFGPRVKHSTSSNEYRELMRFLSVVRMSLTELVGSDQDYYDFIKSKITERAQSTKIYEMLTILSLLFWLCSSIKTYLNCDYFIYGDKFGCEKIDSFEYVHEYTYLDGTVSKTKMSIVPALQSFSEDTGFPFFGIVKGVKRVKFWKNPSEYKKH